MCGIFGIVTTNSVGLPFRIRDHLLKIQHRGYDGAGMALSTKHHRIQLYKEYGLINEVLTDQVLETFNSNHELTGYGIGHTRYKTVGECSAQSSQPLLDKNQQFCLVHNGQIVHHTNPDSSLLLEYFTKSSKHQMTLERLETIISQIFQEVQGSYSCLLMIHNFGLVAFRDPRGIRPLVITHTANEEYLIASETSAFQNETQQSNFWDLPPGSYALFKNTTSRANHRPHIRYYQTQLIIPQPTPTPCIFEYIYLAHWISTINGLYVRQARILLGQLLAQKILEDHPKRQIDIVIPVPSTSKLAAQSLARAMNVEYRELIQLNPNRKYPRSFILPTQEMRELAVQDKFTIDPHANVLLKNKKILLVDDSVIRGTTLKCLVKMFRINCPEIKRIKVASISPKVVNKNIYGIDIPNTQKLVAYNKTDDEIAQLLNVDWIIFQDLDRMLKAFRTETGFLDFEHSIFIEPKCKVKFFHNT